MFANDMDARRPYHIQTQPGQVGSYALLTGDPGRVEMIASRLEGAGEIAANREFRSWSGTLGGVPVTVTSTGIGGPSAAIAVEELCDSGVHTFIRIGTCGAMQPDQRSGDLVIAQAAVRDEGTTRQYAPLAWPAVADPDITMALRKAAAEKGARCSLGVVHSKDSFYGEMDPGRMPVAESLKQRWQAWIRLGVLATEMECAALFAVAAVRRVRAGAVLVVINESPEQSGMAGMPQPQSVPIDDVTDVAIDGLRRVIGLDSRS
jgi:uridine phosphorylase